MYDFVFWLCGVDVDDEDKDGFISDLCNDIFGDLLYLKFVMIDYGNDDIWILIGINVGYLYMF